MAVFNIKVWFDENVKSVHKLNKSWVRLECFLLLLLLFIFC